MFKFVVVLSNNFLFFESIWIFEEFQRISLQVLKFHLIKSKCISSRYALRNKYKLKKRKCGEWKVIECLRNFQPLINCMQFYFLSSSFYRFDFVLWLIERYYAMNIIIIIIFIFNFTFSTSYFNSSWTFQFFMSFFTKLSWTNSCKFSRSH